MWGNEFGDGGAAGRRSSIGPGGADGGSGDSGGENAALTFHRLDCDEGRAMIREER